MFLRVFAKYYIFITIYIADVINQKNILELIYENIFEGSSN